MQQEDQSQLEVPWADTIARVLKILNVAPDRGLADQHVKRRRRTYGSNRLRKKKTQSISQIFLNQFKSLILLILIGAASLSFAFGQIIDGIVISAAVLLNTLIGFMMELRAARSMESLRRMEQMTAKVLRDGQIQEISADWLVPGDIVMLEAGDVVSADMRLLEANKIRVNESALTGESIPVGKQVEPVQRDALLPDRKNMLYKGTHVTAGSCKGVVTQTGMNTELGKISSLVEQAEDEETPLEKRLQTLGQRLLWITLGILVVVAITGIIQGKEILLMIKTAIALAVAAIPEGLPIVATVAMARGMLRMARRNALVNRLAAVETLGSTTVICTDKTGTLTKNKMTVSRIVLDENEFAVKEETGAASKFFCKDNPIETREQPTLLSLLEAGVLCNNASLGLKTDDATIGDPLEVALLEAGAGAGLEREGLLQKYPEQREESFDPSVKMMATFNKDETQYRVMVKGAPEAVLEASSHIQSGQKSRDMPPGERQKWNDKNLHMAREGLRILAVATKNTDSLEANPYQDLIFLGLVAMADPPREEVVEAINHCREAGIRVVMVTGDHAATAKSVAQTVGLIESDSAEVIEGMQIKPSEKLSQEQRDKLVRASIFSRVSPEQKLFLIDLHQQAGAVVAMTGDGVNDAPALKKADIGIAMGQRGTQVAREAAEMILKDDAFSSIVVAVEQGRIIFGNIRKFVLYLLSGNASEILVVFVASVLNWPLPILPLQILFLNIINDVFPALALGVGKGSPDTMRLPPRDPKEPVLTFAYWWAIFSYGVLIMMPVLAGFHLATILLKMSNEKAVTVSFLTLAFARLWHIFNMRTIKSRLLCNEITTNRYVWIALLFCSGLLIASVYVPGLSTVLSLSGLGVEEWILIGALSLIPLVIGQVTKAMRAIRSGKNGHDSQKE